jgi:hypothetical protein
MACSIYDFVAPVVALSFLMLAIGGSIVAITWALCDWRAKS